MTRTLGIIMDPIDRINIKKDSSFAMLLEAHARGFELHYFELQDLWLRNGQAFGRSRKLRVQRDAQQWFEWTGQQTVALHDLDVMLMRKDPPFDQDYLYTTYILEQAERQGLLVVNKAQSLRDANEKMFTAWFPQCCTDTLVARNPQQLRDFLAQHHDIILKPLDGMGGASIFRVTEQDPNISVILETMTAHGQHFIMAQRYLPAIKDGDKRILMINGEPVPYCLARIPASGESRGNLAAGGRGEGRPLSERDRWLAAQVGPTLREKGLLFVGMDVIGDYVTEINVTSPTCIQELDQQFGLNISGQFMDVIEARLSA